MYIYIYIYIHVCFYTYTYTSIHTYIIYVQYVCFNKGDSLWSWQVAHDLPAFPCTLHAHVEAKHRMIIITTRKIPLLIYLHATYIDRVNSVLQLGVDSTCDIFFVSRGKRKRRERELLMQRRLGLLVSAYSNTTSNNTGIITQPNRSILHNLAKFSTAHYHTLNNTLSCKATNPIVSNLIPYPNYHHNHSPYWVSLIRRINQNFINRRSMSSSSSSKHFPPQQQEGQPGREHEMQPSPEFVRPSYKPSDKLLVIN